MTRMPPAGLEVREDGEKIVLENAGRAGRVPTLPDEQFSTGTPAQPGSNGQGLPDDSLESAIAVLGGDARSTGEEPAGIRQQAALRERQALVEWAEKSGLRIDPASWAGKATIGGSEHDIWEDGGEVWKATRPDRFGWTVLPGEDGSPEIAEATPLEYLQRWANANRVLGDSARLRGVAVTDENIFIECDKIMRRVGHFIPADMRFFHQLERADLEASRKAS